MTEAGDKLIIDALLKRAKVQDEIHSEFERRALDTITRLEMENRRLNIELGRDTGNDPYVATYASQGEK